MNKYASGTFEVRLAPQTIHDEASGTALKRTSIDKEFHGDLKGTSRGEMLSTMTEVKGSAGYVAIEQVEGALGGRRGSFVLQHNGVMTRGTPELTVHVVPDSGTGELVGLSGTMTIDMVDGKHSYEFMYTLGERP